jgi:hypothetical protein
MRKATNEGSLVMAALAGLGALLVMLAIALTM